MRIIKGISRTFVSLLCALSLNNLGCAKYSIVPASVAETASGYTYIPIDPTKVQIEPGDCLVNYSSMGNGKNNLKLLDVLPDNAVRMSMELSDSDGHVTYGVSKIHAAGSSYKLTADYVNSDTVNKKVWIGKKVLIERTSATYGFSGFIKTKTATERELVPARMATDQVISESQREQVIRVVPDSEVYEVISSPTMSDEQRGRLKDDFQEYNVPVYVGIGLRIIAQGTSLSGDANISGVGVVGAEAEAKRLLGSLMVQTLGVNSQAVASALPVHSELSRTTAENAFVAIGSIKALLHQPDTINFPRVVGMYLPFPGGRPLVNALISELSRNPVKWCPIGHSKQDIAVPVSVVQ